MTTISAGVRSEVGCRCCQRKQSNHESLPGNGEQDGACNECFCNSPVNTISAVEVEQDVHSLAIWTVVESRPQARAIGESIIETWRWLPGDGSGMSLRLAVRSLLL
ncbi:hypothetical protein NA78x_004107 [Anatilimnocola sp. NA78]|uniref:hypothetical protein n=1 Tax=Anatilimnocola sp. NA78 TaxID=3415683 RepID=UPI003CE54CBD